MTDNRSCSSIGDVRSETWYLKGFVQGSRRGNTWSPGHAHRIRMRDRGRPVGNPDGRAACSGSWTLAWVRCTSFQEPLGLNNPALGAAAPEARQPRGPGRQTLPLPDVGQPCRGGADGHELEFML